MRRFIVALAALLVVFAAACVGPNPPPPPSTTTTTSAVRYTFDDEFNGTHVDTSKWRPNWLGSSDTTVTKPVNGAERSCYDPAQVTEGGGYLHLTAVARSCRASNGTTYPYASGLIESDGHFTFASGTVTFRAFIPGNGSTITNWPAIWSDGTGTWPNTGEYDAMEGLSGNACYHVHTPSGGPGGCPAGDWTGWHTFGYHLASDGTVTFIYDGRTVGTEHGVAGAAQYLVANLGVGGYGGPIASPSTMLVDWVHVTR